MTNRETILVELYWQNDQLHTFVVRRTDSVPQVFSVALSRQRLHEYISSFQMAFTQNNAEEREYGAWSELATFLLGDRLGKLITDSSHIVFVPHGLFHHFPLHLLPFNGAPLVMTCPVSYCPSATLLVECRKRSQKVSEQNRSPRLLAIGVDFEGEARMVHATVKSSSLWVESERPIEKAPLLAQLKDFQWIHFSCHGIFDVQEPMQSGLVLCHTDRTGLTLAELRQRCANYLTATEISNGRLNAALVTLSACETAQTKDLPGDEILGLTRAFFLAGAAAVMVSFWPVPAGATHDFMQSFYRQLVTESVPLSEAVHAAYLSTAKLYPDSFSWAGFALVGDGISPWKLN
jgi:CHAT domain-containing protein